MSPYTDAGNALMGVGGTLANLQMRLAVARMNQQIREQALGLQAGQLGVAQQRQQMEAPYMQAGTMERTANTAKTINEIQQKQRQEELAKQLGLKLWTKEMQLGLQPDSGSADEVVNRAQTADTAGQIIGSNPASVEAYMKPVGANPGERFFSPLLGRQLFAGAPKANVHSVQPGGALIDADTGKVIGQSPFPPTHDSSEMPYATAGQLYANIGNRQLADPNFVPPEWSPFLNQVIQQGLRGRLKGDGEVSDEANDVPTPQAAPVRPAVTPPPPTNNKVFIQSRRSRAIDALTRIKGSPKEQQYGAAIRQLFEKETGQKADF